jgi:hypothetical protein
MLMTCLMPRFCGTKEQRDSESQSISGAFSSGRLQGKMGFSAAETARKYASSKYAFQNVVWDTPSHSFKLRIDNYLIVEHLDSFEKTLNHGTVLSDDFVAGAIVDQVGQKIILPDGRWIDGPTGDIYNVHGDVLVYRNPEQAKKTTEAEKSI